MSLLKQAQLDIEQITTNYATGFAVIALMYLSNGTAVEVKGTTARHYLAFDTDGVKISSLNAHVSFSEKTLTDAGVTVRNANSTVDLLGKRVQIRDSAEVLRDYVVVEQYPDETIGLIVLILGAAEEATLNSNGSL